MNVKRNAYVGIIACSAVIALGGCKLGQNKTANQNVNQPSATSLTQQTGLKNASKPASIIVTNPSKTGTLSKPELANNSSSGFVSKKERPAELATDFSTVSKKERPAELATDFSSKLASKKKERPAELVSDFSSKLVSKKKERPAELVSDFSSKLVSKKKERPAELVSDFSPASSAKGTILISQEKLSNASNLASRGSLQLTKASQSANRDKEYFLSKKDTFVGEGVPVTNVENLVTRASDELYSAGKAASNGGKVLSEGLSSQPKNQEVGTWFSAGSKSLDNSKKLAASGIAKLTKADDVLSSHSSDKNALFEDASQLALAGQKDVDAASESLASNSNGSLASKNVYPDIELAGTNAVGTAASDVVITKKKHPYPDIE